MVIDVSMCAPTIRFTLKLYSLSPLFLDLLSPSPLTITLPASLFPRLFAFLLFTSISPRSSSLRGTNAAVVGADV